MFVLLDGDTELARCSRSDGASKECLHFDNQKNKFFSFSSSRCFLKEIEHMYSVFLSNYTNTHESLGELEKAVETQLNIKLPTERPNEANMHLQRTREG